MSGEYIPKKTEITRTMIDAGIAIYLAYCPDTGAGDALDRQMMKEIFTAMAESYLKTANVD